MSSKQLACSYATQSSARVQWHWRPCWTFACLFARNMFGTFYAFCFSPRSHVFLVSLPTRCGTSTNKQRKAKHISSTVSPFNTGLQRLASYTSNRLLGLARSTDTPSASSTHPDTLRSLNLQRKHSNVFANAIFQNIRLTLYFTNHTPNNIPLTYASRLPHPRQPLRQRPRHNKHDISHIL